MTYTCEIASIYINRDNYKFRKEDLQKIVELSVNKMIFQEFDVSQPVGIIKNAKLGKLQRSVIAEINLENSIEEGIWYVVPRIQASKMKVAGGHRLKIQDVIHFGLTKNPSEFYLKPITIKETVDNNAN